MPRFALVSDFDGTISHNDFFYYIAERYFDEKALTPWYEYLAGTKKHFIALSEMFADLRISEKELQEFILTIKLDKTFFTLAAFCQKQNIPVYICSAGCDYYIKVLLNEKINRYQMTLVSNSGTYSPKTGLTMQPNQQYPDKNLGISKTNLVKDLKKQGYQVIFCGDGPPDIEPAKLADKVFARKTLYQECLKQNIKADFLTTFTKVKNYIKEHTNETSDHAKSSN